MFSRITQFYENQRAESKRITNVLVLLSVPSKLDSWRNAVRGVSISQEGGDDEEGNHIGGRKRDAVTPGHARYQ